MNDFLLKSAIAYQQLLTVQYQITLGRKGVATNVNIVFPEDAYHHLAGFHYVGFALLQNRKTALRSILEGKLVYRDFMEAGYTANADYDLESRWASICWLQEMLEHDLSAFYYRGHEPKWSKIDADYVLLNPTQYFFIRNDEPVSIFGNRSQGYEQRCTRYKVLQVFRVDKTTQERTLTYQSPVYMET